MAIILYFPLLWIFFCLLLIRTKNILVINLNPYFWVFFNQRLYIPTCLWDIQSEIKFFF